MKPLADCKLYTFVDTAYLYGRAPELVAQQLCDGGSDLIQLRAKNSSPDEIRALAEKILPVTCRANVGFVINDQYLNIVYAPAFRGRPCRRRHQARDIDRSFPL